MTDTRWDPAQYARFGDERSRPFVDLVARIGATDPQVVVDLGCGNGPLTLSLADRWPHATVIGIDHSEQMLAVARDLDTEGRVRWVEADLADWQPASLGATPDVVVTNAALQWVPGHQDLIDRVVTALPPGGWFAMQVPDNLDAPSHALMREVAAEHSRAAELIPAVTRLQVERPQTYLEQLAGLGCAVDVWSTTYLHVLDPGGAVDDPVLEWVRGTGLRPVLALLTDPSEREEFLVPYREKLRAAYPRSSVGVVLPFRRTFAVACRRN
ncbi:MAG TPA: methyltransferase domain-containing protein [Intrasporangiaceae bacterium]|nr:methyltransferase domain-containing protein [Intrasporangiaceae bacterium]